MTKHRTLFPSGLAAAAAALGLLCSAANAATVYRCGPQGNIYSDAPCTDGRPVDAADVRSDEQRSQAIRVAALDKRFAADMQRERLMLAATRPALAGSLSAQPLPVVVSPAAHPRNHKRHAGRKTPVGADFVAIAPTARR